MFATHEGQRLYLTSWVYNGSRVMSRVAKLVEMKGGKVKYNESMNVTNRDENPFFEFHYTKTPIVNGKYSRNAYLEESGKSWVLNGLFEIGCSSETIDKAAELLLDELLNANKSGIHREGKKCRVQNYGDCGYHYEVRYTAERWETVDF